MFNVRPDKRWLGFHVEPLDELPGDRFNADGSLRGALPGGVSPAFLGYDFGAGAAWPGSTMFSVRPEQDLPGLHNFKPPEEAVPGFRVRQPDEQAPGFRMNADGSIGEAAATTARRYPGVDNNPFDFLDRPGPGGNGFTPVADKPPWGGWGMSPYPEDNDNEQPNMSSTPVCDRANFLCLQFGRGATKERYGPWVYDCSNSYGICQNYERDPNRIGRLGDRIEFPDGSAVIFRRGYPPSYVPSPRR